MRYKMGQGQIILGTASENILIGELVAIDEHTGHLIRGQVNNNKMLNYIKEKVNWLVTQANVNEEYAIEIAMKEWKRMEQERINRDKLLLLKKQIEDLLAQRW